MEEYICPICGEIMKREYDNENNHLMLVCSDRKYNESEFKQCKDCGNYFHESLILYNKDKNEFYCGDCINNL